MKSLRILALMHKDLVPPESVEGLPYKQVQPYKTEYDILAALEELGHEVRSLGVHDDLSVLRAALTEFKPHLTFNILEEFHDVSLYGQAVISYLELMRAPYSGCNPRGLMLAHDKPLAKKILMYHSIRTPRFAVVPLGGHIKRPARLGFPLIVKSAVEDASLGISKASVVKSDEKLQERIKFMHDQFGTDVMIEEFIPGRELYVGVIGNQRLKVLPIWEMSFDKWEEGAPRLATSRVKWDPHYQEEKGITTGPAQDLDAATEREIVRVCKSAYRALGLSGYARMDLRLGEDGHVYLIEPNANPDLASDEDFARSAEAAGITYDELIDRIVKLGLAWRPAWKG